MLAALAMIVTVSAGGYDRLLQEEAKPGVSGLALCRGRYEALADYLDRRNESAEDLAALDTRLNDEIAARVGAESGQEADRLSEVARVNREAGRAYMASLIYRSSSGFEYPEAIRAFAGYRDALADCRGLLEREGVPGAPAD